jgi:hypothetical protein
MRHYGLVNGLLLLGLVTLLAGCDQFALKPKPAPAAPTTSAAPGQPMPGTTGLMPPGDLSQMGAPVAGAPTGAAPAAPGTTQQVAGVGSGSQGRSLDDPNLVGVIVAPARAMFAAKERIIYDKMMHDLQLYKTGEGEGMGPPSHEEFMEKVIQANGTVLPNLPPGQRYIYDPKTEQLMVEKPAKK